MKYYSLIYFYVELFTFTNSAPTFDLRIEFNRTLDKLAALDKMDVAFVNKVTNETAFINNRISDLKPLGEPNYDQDASKHPLKYDSDIFTNVEHSRTNNINIDTKNNTATFKQLDAHNVKEKLDSFAMAKRKTYAVTPAFKYPRKNEDSFENVQIDVDNGDFNYQNFNKVNNILTIENIQNPPYRNKRNEMDNNKISEDVDILTLLNHPEVVEILKKQNNIIETLESQLRNERVPVLRSDFDDLLTSIENKRNKTDTDIEQKRITAEPTTTAKPSTVLTMVDQTEVRKALMENPFVHRILKMAKLKKMEFMKNAKKQYGNMIYI